ncbi:hypothetical protein GEMRC1_002449 [Eukaryota sp. GEM-RC1]
MSLIERLRSIALKHTIRFDDVFVDFDPLRSGKVTRPQFERVVSTMGFNLKPDELTELSDSYLSDVTSLVEVVNYRHFINDLHCVFTDPNLHKDPDLNVTDVNVYKRMEQISFERPSSSRLELLLSSIQQAVTTRRMVMKSFFESFDKDNDGCLVKSQFTRCFPFQISPEDLELICNYFKRPCTSPSTFLVDYRSFHRAVTEDDESSVPPPRKQKVTAPAVSEDITINCEIVDKIALLVNELRVDLKPFFEQFDPLHKGYVCQSYFLTAIGMAKLPLTQEDYNGLLIKYRTAEIGMFDYRQLCFDVESFVITSNLEKTEDFDFSSLETKRCRFDGISGRRRHIEAMTSEIFDCLARISKEVLTRRILVKQYFRNFDKLNRGYVTHSQFYQCLSLAGLKISTSEFQLLLDQFGVRGTDDLIDYFGFVAIVDPEAPKI